MRAKLPCPLGDQKFHAFSELIDSGHIIMIVRHEPLARCRGELP